MKRTNRTISRRALLKAAAAAGAAPLVARAAAPARARKPPPSDRVTLGMIGLGSMGLRHVKGFLQESGCRIIAVCDVDAVRRRGAAALIDKHYGCGDCAQYNDFRELLARGDLDAVCIAVPDHWHAVVSILAVRAGKDIYGEKPLARTIPEGRAIVRAVQQAGCVWQTGSWQRSTRHFRFACELVRNRRIGELQRVEVGIGLGHEIGPQPVMPVPEGFDYEMWLGPAPWAPYTEKRCHWNFRWISDYSGGQVTDWGAHHVDIAHWGMDADETGPVSVVGRGEFPEDGLYDEAVRYRFDCEYASGVKLHVGSNNYYPQGVRWIGDRGWVHVSRAKVTADPQSLLRTKFAPDEVRLPRPSGDHRQGHREDFLHCVRTRQRTISGAEASHRSIAVAHLGNIAMRLGRKLRWDPQAERFVSDPQANRMLSRAMREPWRL